MSRERKPSEQLSGYFGIDITDAESLRQLFSRVAAGKDDWPEGVDILVPRSIYDRYVQLYNLSWKLADALDTVLDDAEHRLAMEEAQELGYSLPDFDLFHRELSVYREFLRGHDPYRAQPAKDGQRLRVPKETAHALHELANYNCLMVGRIFDGCFNTEYMKHFGFLKRSGFHYCGATALQETLNVLVAMIGIKTEIDQYMDERISRSKSPGGRPDPKP